MVRESSVSLWSPQDLLRDKVRLVKRKDSAGRYEIVPIDDPLTFEKGFCAFVRACQLLSQKNDGLILVGLAGLSGAGKSVFTEKISNFLRSIAIINMDSYIDGARATGRDFDDKRLTDYDKLLDNIHGLKDGQSVQVPIYDFKSNSRIGYRTVEVPSSRIVILEGIYALSEKLRPFLDLRVSVTGGVSSNLVKRVLGDIQRPGQDSQETVRRIFETVYPTYEALIEPDLKTAHINIENNFDPSGFQNPTYILKSTKALTPEQMKAVLSEDFKERTEETRDIYLLPPGEDPKTCQSFLRMRNRDGRYYLTFEESFTDCSLVISPGITFQVNVRLLGGLMALGYTLAAISERTSHIFDDDKVTVKSDRFKQLNRTHVQVRGRDRTYVENVANQLGLEASSYVPHTYIELMQLEKRVKKVMALPDDLKTKVSLIPSQGALPRLRASADSRAPAATLPNQGVITRLIYQISTVNERMDECTYHLEELNSSIPNRRAAAAAAASGSLLSALMEEVELVTGRQHEITLQMDILTKLVHEHLVLVERSRTERVVSDRANSTTQNLGPSTVPVLLAVAIGWIGILAYSLK
ncbi:Phosphoribulokinase / Uridine kinase family [Raphanus sativus]|uniref:Inorganic pyrophosphatase TTM1 n=1 Tax=Raphanus sativus TaxID=3726 RepID=A0A6J0L4G8_RAPSA|nr:inorganic pyrophosphatase TTM1 [Raphanus sativus]XP_056849335.1 inorganic pyrophosphatase TTM1 [Raphanus sativus]KAJ4875074.1 Phosphoribulokinase / Uridine kinase family [Raphanus sativus]